MVKWILKLEFLVELAPVHNTLPVGFTREAQGDCMQETPLVWGALNIHELKRVSHWTGLMVASSS